MLQPQPEAEPPAAEPPRGVPTPRAGEPAVPVDQPESTLAEPAGSESTLAEPAGSESTAGATDTTGTDTRPDPDGTTAAGQPRVAGTAPAGPAPTRLEVPRWTGSAPVPPAARRDRPGQPVPAPRNPAGDLPVRSPETAEPVDPWADADTEADPWTVPGTAYPPVSPTLPYPASGPAPTRPYPVPPDPGPAVGPAAHPFPGPPVSPPQPVTPRPVTPPPAASRPVSPPPVPAPPARPAPSAGPSGRSLKRRQPDRPQPAPPDWQAPRGYVPVAVRRKRRWPGRMMLLTLLTIACCCGCPAYFGKPMWEQYPAKAALPDQVRDLTLRDDAASQRLSQRLVQETGAAHLLAEDIFAGVYRTSGKQVIVFGSTGFRLTPEQDVTDELTRLGTTYQITGIESIETDLRGQYQSCGTGRLDGAAVVVCTWADHGSLGTGVFTRLSVTDSAALLAEFRDGIVTRG
ncbi:hypothetical protein V6U90_02250 [Micromonospora sp. CPCC 206060]|uniref:hypothetical protein n=1 Tax=Micromonospora sp. CPCC 206060 TaxID=3122406 RepID=UPI002FF4307E